MKHWDSNFEYVSSTGEQGHDILKVIRNGETAPRVVG